MELLAMARARVETSTPFHTYLPSLYTHTGVYIDICGKLFCSRGLVIGSRVMISRLFACHRCGRVLANLRGRGDMFSFSMIYAIERRRELVLLAHQSTRERERRWACVSRNTHVSTPVTLLTCHTTCEYPLAFSRFTRLPFCLFPRAIFMTSMMTFQTHSTSDLSLFYEHSVL